MRIVDFKHTKSGDVISNEAGGVHVKWGNNEKQFLTLKKLDERIGSKLIGKKRYRFYIDSAEVHLADEGK